MIARLLLDLADIAVFGLSVGVGIALVVMALFALVEGYWWLKGKLRG